MGWIMDEKKMKKIVKNNKRDFMLGLEPSSSVSSHR
jgi:hypothetical protein